MAPHAQPATVPPLAPSVESAYHDKCKELRVRTKEVEDANDASCLRLDRMKRQVFKLRLERAFLLEQLARRTSTNVEDSDGSPSPGPAPENKPLRSKRGHRKSSLIADQLAGGPHAGFFSDKLAGTAATASPAPSDSYKAANGSGAHAATPTTGAIANTAASISLRPPRRPAEPFDLYVSEMRPVAAQPRGSAVVTSTTATPRDGTPKLDASNATPPKATKSASAEIDADADDADASANAGADVDADPDVTAEAGADDEDLVRGWKDLSDKERHEYEARHEREMEQYEKAQEVYASAQKPRAERGNKPDDDDDDDDNDDGADDEDDEDDDDIEMAHDDDDDDDEEDAADPDDAIIEGHNS